MLHFIDLSISNSWIEYQTDCKLSQVSLKNILQSLKFNLNIADILMNSSVEKDSTSEDGAESSCMRVPLPGAK